MKLYAKWNISAVDVFTAWFRLHATHLLHGYD